MACSVDPLVSGGGVKKTAIASGHCVAVVSLLRRMDLVGTGSGDHCPPSRAAALISPPREDLDTLGSKSNSILRGTPAPRCYVPLFCWQMPLRPCFITMGTRTLSLCPCQTSGDGLRGSVGGEGSGPRNTWFDATQEVMVDTHALVWLYYYQHPPGCPYIQEP